MKILKSILLALAAILAIASVGIYFLPDYYNISKTIVIHKPADVVYSHVSNFNNWAAWSPFQEMDPKALNVVESAPSSAGHKLSWYGEKSGKGNMTISDLVPPTSMNSNLVFIKPFNATAKDYWKLEQMGDSTKVIWGTEGGLSYPLGRLFGLSVDKMLGQMQQHGLDNLKKVCEAMPDAVALDSMAVVVIR